MDKEIPEKLGKTIETFKNYATPSTITFGILIIIVFFILTYLFTTIQKKGNNCDTISKYKTLYNIKPVTNLNYSTSLLMDKKIKDFHIKTAYNCCCTGNLKNDYVDICGLKNCAKRGVRALDFQIYSLNNKPIVSGSSLSNESVNFKYKEIYNYLGFYETMTYVKTYFLTDQNNCDNTVDPLFLIFRLYTDKRSSMDSMADTLISIFDKTNYLYYLSGNKTLDNISLTDVMGKVVIIIDPTNASNYSNSKLKQISSLNLGTLSNKIYRESEVINELQNITYDSSSNEFATNINMLYPDLNPDVYNYDSITTGINTGIQFIAMNYQLNDDYLTQFENKFKDYSTNTGTSMILKNFNNS